MNRSKNLFSGLAQRVESGDSSAQLELRRSLEPEMIRIVRRVVQCGAGRSSMDRRILAEAGRIGLDAVAAASEDGERLICKVAHCISACFVEGMRSSPLDRGRIDETVCN